MNDAVQSVASDLCEGCAHRTPVSRHPSVRETASLLTYAYTPRSLCTAATRSIESMYDAVRMFTSCRLA